MIPLNTPRYAVLVWNNYYCKWMTCTNDGKQGMFLGSKAEAAGVMQSLQQRHPKETYTLAKVQEAKP